MKIDDMVNKFREILSSVNGHQVKLTYLRDTSRKNSDDKMSCINIVRQDVVVWLPWLKHSTNRKHALLKP